jgi:hypothetical protein
LSEEKGMVRNMLKIEEYVHKNSYDRVIESQGEGLLYIRIYKSIRSIGAFYHYTYCNEKKPPLDIAIHPERKELEYITYFFQDEKIEKKIIDINILLRNENIMLSDIEFSEKRYYIREYRDYDVSMYRGVIYIIEKGIKSDLEAFPINARDYLLVNNKERICGLMLLGLSEREIRELEKSKVI